MVRKHPSRTDAEMTDDEKIVHHELAHDALIKSQDYIGRGRHLEGLDESALEFEFVSSVQLIARDGDDHRSRLAMNDAFAEFDLRGLQPPIHLIRAEIESIESRGRARIAAMSPEVRQRIENDILARYTDAKRHTQ